MATETTHPGLDLDSLRRGIEDRDARTLSGLYAEDAELRVVDRDNPPSSPLELHGSEQIGRYLSELCDRDMTHRLEHVVASNGEVAFVQACRYPDGNTVLCHAVLETEDGLIVRQHGIQAWD